ncbi:MAG: response regulator, partial [Myxococcota bacterium]
VESAAEVRVADRKRELDRADDLVAAAGSARELRVIEGTPESLLVDTSAGSVVPASVAAVPLVHYDEVIGAVELALPVGNPNLRGRLDAILPTVAGVLAARLDQQRIHRLLEHSRNQALELQQLNQKLDERAMLLMEQQHALEESHAELQLQTETLSMQREELIETNTELQRARELAEEHARELDTANRYKSQFLANMSHELRTPLNSILILARLLVEDDGERLDEDQLESARSIGSAGRDLLELINDILDISRIEVGELRIAPVRFDFEKSIRTLDRLFRPVAEERGLDFVLDLELDVPDRVVVDELRLHQILRNLLSNAFKFTDRGNVTLRVASGLAPDRITFAVADTGVGIPPEAQAQIFNAFSQADGSLTRKHTGAGLGLAISRQLAERMGGSLSLADSSPGGSTFVLDIPVGLPDATPAAAPQRARDPGRSRVADEGEIVIVEADPVLGRTLTTLAHIQGYRAKWFADGKDAYLHCLRAPPSCVLVDLRLPETPGEPLLEALSEDARTRDIPVHALSGVATTRPGTASLLAKPIRSDRFVEWLGKSLRHLGGEALLVEANDSEALAMTKLLAHHGVTCRRAADLDAVREGCAGTPVQCILLGLDLDLHDAEAGARLLADLGRDPELGTLPVIAYTSRELDDDEQAELQRHPRSIIVEQTKADPVVDETRRPAGNLSRGLSQRRVLVVDDDVRNVFALRQLLRHREIEVVVAEDGAEALRRVDEDGPFDAILMDVMMPVMDGLEATRRLRARPDGESFFIVALTAKAMPGDRERCLRAGASDYLAKPIDNDVLLWRLAAHFRTSPPHTPLSPAGGAA